MTKQQYKIKELKNECQVLVVGGGTAGTIAAIQSARAGADTILVEMNNQLGGTMTTGGVSYPVGFFAGPKQIIGGIGLELVKKCLALDNSKMPDLNRLPNSPRPVLIPHIPINKHLYCLTAEDECLKAGAAIHYQETVVSVEKLENTWKVRTSGNMLTRTIIAKELIDCTGDATVVRLAGGQCQMDSSRQPGTMSFNLTGYNWDSLDAKMLEQGYKKAIENGQLLPGDYCYSDQPFKDFLKNGGGNLQHIINADSSDSELNTQANINSRQSLLRMIRFLKTIPGLEKTTIARMSTNIGIRETWRIIGEKTINKDEYMSGKIYDDAIAWTYYFIDIHHEKGVYREFLPQKIYPTIPFGSLIPKNTSRLLTAGRTISSDKAAFSALRVQASCMAMGQAAGAAAALAVKTNTASKNVPIDTIKKLLKEHNAIVPGIE